MCRLDRLMKGRSGKRGDQKANCIGIVSVDYLRRLLIYECRSFVFYSEMKMGH